MIGLLKIIFKSIPWILLVAILSWLLIEEKIDFGIKEGSKDVYQNNILTQVEAIGKLELAQYHFQEVTELNKNADYVELFSRKFKLAPDARALLISQGSAAGCIDLTNISKADIDITRDTLFITIPQPELCYYKIDLANSRFYDLEVTSLDKKKRQEFMEEIYRLAESQIKQSALELGILEQTRENAHRILDPMLEKIAGKPVVISFQMAEDISPEFL
ncbi:MAG: hypothetical protein CMB80_24035 [Flammeovirgaceae bacterium]|nr:hypothetical protein [Flammeovirgaceae bacterium]MBE62048.1 hypothetical protein [Flammeovirgaceae bacterium]HCX21748.1 DUF4230 domain-containing protein [Cytophagales bacterium]|tara:strand:+ start:63 stop:716 length:654 start_codon:yes stop_codon:yes gene_type:complete